MRSIINLIIILIQKAKKKAKKKNMSPVRTHHYEVRTQIVFLG